MPPKTKRSKRRTKPAPKRWRFWAGLVLLAPLVTWIGLVSSISFTTRNYVYATANEVPSAPVGIVFGAGLSRKGKPSRVLQDRLNGAIELYQQGKVKRLLMSGDNRFTTYNEPKAMRDYAVRHSVKPSDIDLDYAGRDTYDTCYRAKKVFGIDKAILITQSYHAPRAVFVGRALGIDSVAYGVPNLTKFPMAQLSFSCREYLADLKAVWDVSASHRKPYISMRSGSSRL